MGFKWCFGPPELDRSPLSLFGLKVDSPWMFGGLRSTGPVGLSPLGHVRPIDTFDSLKAHQTADR
jgi:hypothetical protein